MSLPRAYFSLQAVQGTILAVGGVTNAGGLNIIIIIIIIVNIVIIIAVFVVFILPSKFQTSLEDIPI